MTPEFPSLFTRPGRRLAFAGLLLAAASAQAAESAPKNTVFKSDAGDAWTVSIKPASRVAESEPRTIPVPRPVDVIPAVAQVEVAPPQPGLPETDLPPIPTTSQESVTGAHTAHGVTVVPDIRTSTELLGRRYAEAYRAIPFNRAEYDANPSYRHEAAMELVFGQMRPTTIVKQVGAVAPSTDSSTFTPYSPYLPSHDDLYPWRAYSLRNRIFDPSIVAPGLFPGGCYFPGY